MHIYYTLKGDVCIMKIKWFGHACFLVTATDGTRIVIDPFRRLLGYRMPAVEADIVAVTHEHGDHNQVKAVSGSYLLAREPQSYSKGSVSIKGIKTFHDKVGGAKRGSNTVFVFKVDDLTLCHCGDLGHLLTPEQVEEIGPVDVLLVPVGGTRTLNGAEAAEVMKQLKATVAIPMHYRTKALGIAGRLLFDKVEDFLNAAGQRVTRAGELEITKEQLPDYAGVAVLSYE